jgi:signal transduction histidine kinase
VRAVAGPDRLLWLDRIVSALIALDLLLEATLEAGVAHRPATAIVAVLFAGTVAVRRRWPAGALVACSILALAQEPFQGQLFNVSSPVALFPFLLCAYGVGAWLPWRRGACAAAASALLLIADQLIETYVNSDSGGIIAGLIVCVVVTGMPWVVGRFIAERRARAAAFDALADQAEAEHARREQEAIQNERALIGRELQDIIAHSVSMMVVQAGGARRLLITEPDRARESILTVEQAGRETLAEMRRLLGLLRSDDDPRALAPQPGLDQLDELVSELSERGLACQLGTDGDRVELTPGVDLVAYRVVEGALRSAADGGCVLADVRVRYSPDELGLEVAADRPLPDASPALAALGERVSLYGGRMTVGDGDGSTIRCRLPLEAAWMP